VFEEIDADGTEKLERPERTMHLYRALP
jgi:hypothetical protein